jgi:hypothetical protein
MMMIMMTTTPLTNWRGAYLEEVLPVVLAACRERLHGLAPQQLHVALAGEGTHRRRHQLARTQLPQPAHRLMPQHEHHHHRRRVHNLA